MSNKELRFNFHWTKTETAMLLSILQHVRDSEFNAFKEQAKWFLDKKVIPQCDENLNYELRSDNAKLNV